MNVHEAPTQPELPSDPEVEEMDRLAPLPVDSGPPKPCPKCGRVRPSGHVCNGRRKHQRLALVANANVYDKPPDPEHPSQATKKTLAMLTAHHVLKGEAIKRGVVIKRPDARWQPEVPIELGGRFCPDRASGVVFRCVQEGITGETEPNWKDAQSPGEGDSRLFDGTVIWQRESKWTGRAGYGSLGMKEIVGAMRLSPLALSEGDERRKARNVSKGLRKARRAA